MLAIKARMIVATASMASAEAIQASCQPLASRILLDFE
jgi:hypothetical protein